MLTPLTPARRLAHAIERRAIEAQLVRRLVDMADKLAGEASCEDRERWEREREDLSSVLHGASAMLGDLIEELGLLEDRALALQDGPRVASAPLAPAAA